VDMREQARDWTGDWRNVDQAADPAAMLKFLDLARSRSDIQAARQRGFELLSLEIGNQILDVGCGTGEETQALSTLVGPSGRAIGVDYSEAMVMTAQERSHGSGLPIEFHQGDVLGLEFEDGSFDGTRAERLLMHLENPGLAMAEIVRVTKANGRVVITEPDLGTYAISGGDRVVTRKLLENMCDNRSNGWIGRMLPGLFKSCGLLDIGIEPWTTTNISYDKVNESGILSRGLGKAVEDGAISATEAARWDDDMKLAEDAGVFFYAVTYFTVYGRKA
jgi:ubiquinone/menaquinone biosynthesis C-methylase UbiE